MSSVGCNRLFARVSGLGNVDQTSYVDGLTLGDSYHRCLASGLFSQHPGCHRSRRHYLPHRQRN